MTLNKCIVIGRLGRDVKFHAAASTPVAHFSLATDEGPKDRRETEWHPCVAFGKQAELARDHLAKGMQVYVEGRRKTRTYKAQDGTEKAVAEVVVSHIVFVDRMAAGAMPGTPAASSTDDFDDVPF